MLISIDCFKDVEIRSIISSGQKRGTCDITKKNDVLVYDTNAEEDGGILSAYLSEVLDVYTPESELPKDFPKDNLAYIEEILERDWSIFNLKCEEIKRVVVEICSSIYPLDSMIYKERVGIEKLCDADFLKNNCIMKEFVWEQFKSSIKNINRFHSNHINLRILEELFDRPSLQRVIPKGEAGYYRARISDGEIIKKSEMGPPPHEKTTAGRANSQGISCLYLASDIITTMHEIRARDLDYVSVAEFVSKKDLKIVDLANLDKISPFSVGKFDCEWFAINMKILKKINSELAKPLRRQDSVLDYLPAQYIADFIKSLGYDGICYRSTLNVEGINYAIFDYKKFRCKDVKLYHIASLKYNTVPSI